jgi:hypothetical protein
MGLGICLTKQEQSAFQFCTQTKGATVNRRAPRLMYGDSARQLRVRRTSVTWHQLLVGAGTQPRLARIDVQVLLT